MLPEKWQQKHFLQQFLPENPFPSEIWVEVVVVYDEDGGDSQKSAILGWKLHHKEQNLKKNKNLRKDSRKIQEQE